LTNPLHRWPLPRPCGIPPSRGRAPLQATASPILSSTSAFLQSLDPTATSPGHRRSGPPKHLSWALVPFSTVRRRGSTIRGRSHHPLRSAFRVWLPSWRLAPLDARSGLFHPDSAPGISPCGAFSSREVGPGFPDRRTRLPSAPRISPTRRTAPADIATTGYRALALPRSPLTFNGCLARSRLDAPLGFVPSRVSCRPPCPWLAPKGSPCTLHRNPAEGEEPTGA
jgi:hypothetical protein